MTTIQRHHPSRPPALGGGRPSRPSAPASSGAGLTGKDVLRIFRRRWLMIAIFLVSFGAVSLAGSILWRIKLPKYTVQSFVTLAPPKHSMTGSNPWRSAEMLDRHKKSKARMVKMRSVLKAALDSEEIQATDWFNRLKENDPERNRAMTELLDEIGVNPQPDEDHIRIQMSMYCGSKNQKTELAVIVDQVTKAFISEVNREQRHQRDKEIDTVTISLRAQEHIRDNARAARAERRRIMEVPTMQRQRDSVSVEIDELIKSGNDLMTKAIEMETAHEALYAQDQQGMLLTNMEVQRALEFDPILRNLLGQFKNAQSTIPIVKSKYGPEHQTFKRFTIQIESLRREIDSRRQELVQSKVASLKAFYKQELSNATSMQIQNGHRRAGLMAKRKELATALDDIQQLSDTAEAAQKEIANYAQRKVDLEMLREGNLPATLMASATVPLEPSGPSVPVWTFLGTILGLGLGVSLAFLLELSDTSVKTPTDIASRVELPLLAMVPHADDLLEEIGDIRVACMTSSHSMISEAFRELRTNLRFSGPAENRRSLLITSSSPDDGRTCVAANMAVAIANGGRRVLLVDTNFRRPAIHDLFSLENEPGLSDALSGQAPWEQCVRETQTPNLSIIPSGKLPPNPSDLLGSDLAKETFDAMAVQYDQVILDGPPLLLVTDARVLAAAVDGVIVVVRAGVNTYGIVQRCRRILTQIDAHVVGGVLNGVRATSDGYLQKNYDAFQDYHEVDV